VDAFVQEHLLGVSRTYAVVVPMLPAPLDETVGLAYLLMRIVDTIEDDPNITTRERLALFSKLDDALAGDRQAVQALARPLGELPAEQRLMEQTPEVLRRIQQLEPAYQREICRCAQTMSDGVRTLITRSAERSLAYPAVTNLSELREYCYYVAGTVGEMLCAMTARFLPHPPLAERREEAVALGLGLQLVNILKDAPKDSTHDRRYLPIVQHGGSQADEIYDAALLEARRNLQRGVEYVLAIPAAATGVRQFCGLPVAWGGLTLARAAEDAHAAKIDRPAIMDSIAHFGRVAADDAALSTWLGDLIWPAGSPADAAGDANHTSPA
jgi:farnesyl-diphosphate farnesyltransferase